MQIMSLRNPFDYPSFSLRVGIGQVSGKLCNETVMILT